MRPIQFLKPRRLRQRFQRALRMEALESRRVLATLVVNSLADGDLASLAGDGLVSLREAITAANTDAVAGDAAAGDGYDTIEFSDDLSGVIQLAATQLEISDGLSIVGPGASQLTIDGGDATRIFDVTDGLETFIEVSISGLTLTGGNAIAGAEAGFGGAIRSREHLTLSDSVLEDNRAQHDGGALATHSGNTHISGVTFRENVSETSGAIGKILGHMVIVNSSFLRNQGTAAVGAVYNFSGSMEIVDSLFDGNTSGFLGGGALAVQGPTTVNSSTFVDNMTEGFGGALYNLGVDDTQLFVQNSTIVGNSAGRGGGVHGHSSAPTEIHHSTVIGNVSDEGGGIYTDGNEVFLHHSIVAGNSSTEIVGNIAEGNFNLVGAAASSGGLSNGVNGNLVGVDWTTVVENDGTVATLANNGGPTPTIALLETSPAVDAGDPDAVRGEGTIPENDQRGQNRVNGVIDIGAFEAGAQAVEIDWPAPEAIVFGTALSETQLNASAGAVPGVFAYSPAAGTVLGAGDSQTLTTTFTPDDLTAYHVTSATVMIDVLKADPELDWPTPEAIVFGTPLNATQLNATANIDGTFTYTPAEGTELAAGTHELTVLFEPVDAANYETATRTVTLEVQPAIPELNWDAPEPVVYSTELDETQLNATANVDGSFQYTPAAGAILDAGTHELSVDFTPTDADNYTSASLSVSILVEQAEPEIQWAAPAAIVYGAELGPQQLNATSNVDGQFTYSPDIGSVLDAGTHELSVSFTPSDAVNYALATATVMLVVEPATVDLTWATPEAIDYLTPLGAEQLNPVADVDGEFVFTPPAGTILPVGTHELSAEFHPTDTTNFLSDSVQVEIVIAPSLDYGDAPASYATLLADDGARHVATGPFLGTDLDVEGDGQPSAGADGDDLAANDEDGVEFLTTLVTTSEGSASSVQVVSSQDAKLDAWIDFNADGDWLDEGEQILVSAEVAEGSNILPFTVSAGASSGATFARFRLSSLGSLSPTGLADDGEVEDYAVTLVEGGPTTNVDVHTFGDLEIATIGEDVVVRQAGIQLFRAPAASVGGLFAQGSPNDDTLDIDVVANIYDGAIGGDAGDGYDRLRLSGEDQALDLTQLPDDRLTGLEELDIQGNGANRLRLDLHEAENLRPGGSLLRVTHDDNDVVDYGAGWTTARPKIVDGLFLHSLRQAGTEIEVRNNRAHLNPLNFADTNHDDVVSPIDALIIINSINEQGARPLEIPGTLLEGESFAYLDPSADAFVTPLDALLVINILNNLVVGEGEGPAPLLIAESTTDGFDVAIGGHHDARGDQTIIAAGNSRPASPAGSATSYPVDFRANIAGGWAELVRDDRASIDDQLLDELARTALEQFQHPAR